MILQLAEDSPYLRIPNRAGGFDMVHVAAFNNLPDQAFENLLNQIDRFQLEEEDMSELSARGWRAKARSSRREARQQARQLRKQTKADASASIKFAKAAGIQSGTVKTGGQIVGDVAGKYVDMLGNVLPAIAPALIPGAGAAGSIGGLNLPGRPGSTNQSIQLPEEEESFLQKYGLWIGIGAVVIVGGYFLTRK